MIFEEQCFISRLKKHISINFKEQMKHQRADRQILTEFICASKIHLNQIISYLSKDAKK